MRAQVYDEGTKVMVLVPEGNQAECVVVGVTVFGELVLYKLFRVVPGTLFHATSDYILRSYQ